MNMKPVCGFRQPGALCGRMTCGSRQCSLERGACEDQLPDLHLNLKGCYFDQIQSGEKLEEYRLVTAHWKKRLEGREYGWVLIKRGYPKADDESRIAAREWKGVVIKEIQHDHFGPDPVQVFAIDVSEGTA